MTYRTFDGTSQSETIVDGRFSSSGDIALSDGSVTQGAIYFADDKNTGIYSPSNDEIAFSTAGTSRLVVDSNGKVGIATTSPGDYHTHASNLVVHGTGDSGVTIASGTGSDGRIMFADGITGTAESEGTIRYDHNDDSMYFSTSDEIVLKLDVSKNATFEGTVTCTSLTETSDIALKTNIEPITNVLDKINQITGYKYDFTKSNSPSIGVIAQDVEKVFPELVHGEDGSKSLQYSGLIGALIESVKELSAKVAALESA